jgi:hypothetical protein
MFLADLIKWAINNYGVIVAYVYGHMGYGKTSYALWTAYEVLGDWDKVLDHVFFDLDEAVDFMYKHARRGKRVPIMVFDDAGFFLNRLTWWERNKVRFMEMFNLARSIAACIIFTAPSDEIPRQLLTKTSFRISVRPLAPEEINTKQALDAAELAKEFNLEPYVAVAKGYRLNILPSFLKYVEKEYIDYYPLHYPVFNEYNKIRMKYVRRALEEFRLERARELEESKKREERENLLREAVDMYTKLGPQETLRFLKGKIPWSTAWYWVYERIPRLLKQGGVGEGSPTSTS